MSYVHQQNDRVARLGHPAISAVVRVSYNPCFMVRISHTPYQLTLGMFKYCLTPSGMSAIICFKMEEKASVVDVFHEHK